MFSTHFFISFLDWLHKLSMGEDLAERVDDLICAWDQVVGTELDTVVMLLLGKKNPLRLTALPHFKYISLYKAGLDLEV